MLAWKLQIAFGSSELERKYLEHGGLDASKCNWPEWARADFPRGLWPGSFKVQLARAGSSGLASSTAALKLQSAIGSSGLERIGLEQCGLEASNCVWLERAREDWHCGTETSKCDWLERARADWPRALWP